MRGQCARVRSGPRWCKAWLGLRLLSCWACGSDEPAADGGSVDAAPAAARPDAGELADAAGLDARTATAGLDASAYANLSARAACQLYIEQLCERWQACVQSDVSSCLNRVQYCPDVLFSTGSTRTPAQVAECAQRWSSLSCGEVNAGAIDCTTAGTRAVGEPCLYASQCSSQVCSNAGGASCGVCQATAAEGQACSATEPCAIRLVCSGGICSKPPVVAEEGRFAAGEACSEARGCVKDFACRPTDPAIATSRRCIALPGLDEPCWAGKCSAGHYCASSNLCTLRPATGQPCASDEASGEPDCAAEAYCSGALCVARATAGSPCRSSECGVGLACLEPQPSGIGTCLRVQSEGASCSAPFERCARATECKAGRCEAVASLGLFQSTCGL